MGGGRGVVSGVAGTSTSEPTVSLGLDLPKGEWTEEDVDRYYEFLISLGYTDAEIAAAIDDRLAANWPEEYVNRETGKVYRPHHEAERQFVYFDEPRQALGKGGEGAGKSTAGIIKDLRRLGRSMSGLLVSCDLPHFKRSLWPEFQRWCPWDQVHEKHQHMGNFTWEPYQPFMMAFKNGARLWCGGMDEPRSWWGPNVHFAHFDEAARKKSDEGLKVLDGRVRLVGPNGEPPQLYITTTPQKHWLYHYFGPLRCKCLDCKAGIRIAIQEGEPFRCPECGSEKLEVKDDKEQFKRNSLVVTLLTRENEENLEPDFAARRAWSLTEAEARVYLEAAWEDVATGQRFLPTMLWWEACQESLPALGEREPVVMALDAATGRVSGQSDCFGILGVTRHPERKKDSVAVRYVRAWQPPSGKKLNYRGTERNPGPEDEIRRLAKEYNVVWWAYDPTQLHDLASRLRSERIGVFKEFNQGVKRSVADTDLLHLIQEKRVAHDGDLLLREHISNADRKTDDNGKKLRLVKREDALKIDLAVCLSMAAHECLYLNLG